MTAGPIAPADMPDPAARGFPEAIRRLESRLAVPEAAFRAALDQTGADRAYRFAALYGLLHRLRREERYDEYRQIVQQYEADFGTEDYYETFRVVAVRGPGVDRDTLLRALAHSERAVRALPEVAGVLHQFADVVTALCDMAAAVSPELVGRAERRVSRAIEITVGRYPHYYATRARLRLEAGDTTGARADIGLAIAREDGTARDFARRISKYEGIRLLISIQERQQDLLRTAAGVKSEITDLRREQVQMLGLLAAVVAFLSASVGIAARATLSDGVRLILVSGGVISTVFAALAVAFGGARPARWLPAAITGLVLVGLALLPAVWGG
jgi:hypothetical protein